MSRGVQHSINEVRGEVTRALLPATTENEIRQRVCGQFAASELYSLAWVGRYHPENERVVPVASAGIAETSLTEFSITEESARASLTNKAVDTREIAVGQNPVDDPPPEVVRDRALTHDYQAHAVIPLVHEETLHGVLYLATDRPHGFGASERESLAEVGRTIACALEQAESPANTGHTGREAAEGEMTSVPAEFEQEWRLYETIISSTPDLVYAFDLDYRFIFANDALLEMWGRTYEESIGKTLLEIGYEPWHAEMHEREIDQVVETKEPIRGEVAFEHAELGRRIYDYIFAPVLNDEGEVEAIAGTTRDITERKEAEEALQESKERFRALVNASSDVVYRMSPDWSEMYHLEGQEFIADTDEPTSDWVEKYIHPDDQERVMEAIEEAIRTKSTFELEHRVKQDDGSLGWTHSRAVPRLDEDGDIIEWVGMASDVTERIERERALEKSERRYRTLVENFPNGAVALVDDDLHYRTVGGDPLDVVDVTADEAEGRPVGEVVPPELADKLIPSYEAALNGDSSSFQAESSGQVYQFQVVPVRDTDGDIFAALGMSQDITEYIEARRELAESERRYRTLAENFPNGAVGLFNENLEYTALGGQLLDTLGVEPDDRIGHSLHEIHPDDFLEQIEPHFTAAIEGDPSSFEVEFRGRDVLAHTLPLRNNDGEVFAGMLVIQDITEQREYERKLEESNERLEQFAYAASHDLQEPLRMVSSYLQLIERRYSEELDADGQEFIDYAVNGAERMREMIDALLEYSRVETEGQPFEPVDLTAVFEEVCDDLQFRIEESGAEISRESLPTVHGDKGQLREVFQNLLDNAIEYCDEAPPEIHVGAHRDGDHWMITVEDNGIGIDQENQDRVFEVFERLHSRDEHEGTGIGLALVERIVERHGGDIWVESEPGEGTTFSFTLPATDT